MKREDIQKLLGGYATGTLTEEERQALFAASLDDQELFDALADEEALKQLLADPGYRQELVADLRESNVSLGEKLASWWRRPLPLALAGGVAAIALGFILLQPVFRSAGTVDVAMRQEAPVPESITEKEVAAPEVKTEAAAGGRMRAQSDADRAAPVRGVAEAPARAKRKAAEPSEEAEAQFAATPPPPPAPTKARPQPAGTETPAVGEVTARDIEDALEESAGKTVEAGQLQMAESRQEGIAAGLADEAAPQSNYARRVMRAANEPAPAAAAREDGGVLEATAPLAKSRGTAVPLQCTVERRGAGGLFAGIDPGGALALGDVVRLSVRVPGPGQVYVAELTGGSQWRLLFSGPATRSGPIRIPEQGGLTPPERTGDRTLAILYSREPLSLPEVGYTGALDKSAADLSAELVLRYR